jgi:hypothetical protein
VNCGTEKRKEQEIMNLKDNIDTFKTGNITQFKTFWTKHTTPSPSCGSRWEWQWWYNANIRRKRSETFLFFHNQIFVLKSTVANTQVIAAK